MGMICGEVPGILATVLFQRRPDDARPLPYADSILQVPAMVARRHRCLAARRLNDRLRCRPDVQSERIHRLDAGARRVDVMGGRSRVGDDGGDGLLRTAWHAREREAGVGERRRRGGAFRTRIRVPSGLRQRGRAARLSGPPAGQRRLRARNLSEPYGQMCAARNAPENLHVYQRPVRHGLVYKTDCAARPPRSPFRSGRASA